MITSFTVSMLVSRISLRLVSGSSFGTMPAWASSGSVSLKMRPLERAMVNVSVMASHPVALAASWRGDAADTCTQLRQLLLDALVAAIDMVDAIHQGIALRHQRGDDETRRGAQVGGHHRRTAQLLDT